MLNACFRKVLTMTCLFPENPLFLRKVVDFMGDGLFILDNQGQIIFWNRSMEQISGYTGSEVVGKTCNLIPCNKCFGEKMP